MSRAITHGYHITRFLQEDLLNADEAWMNEHVLPELVKKEPGMTLVATSPDLYDVHEQLYERYSETDIAEKLQAFYESGVGDDSEEEAEAEEVTSETDESKEDL